MERLLWPHIADIDVKKRILDATVRSILEPQVRIDLLFGQTE